MKRIGRYEVVRELRAGGMGSVTLGKSPDGQLVVLKRPHSTDAEAAVRLRDEARIGARLLHPAIVDTLDLFELDSGVPVLVVAYVDGPSLEVLRPLGPLPTGVIARIGRQIAEGLFALHETCDEHGRPLHILHRDVTPGNIVVGRDGDAKLIDLGIARFSERQAEHTQDGFLRGTMRYLAPELLQGDTYSAASDLWALGMVLWEAALGRFAYRGETDREVLAGILRGEPMELDEGERVDEAVVDVIRPLLQLSPLRRLSSGADVAARFAALEAQHGDTAALTHATIAEALERKAAKDAEQKARLAHMLLPENLGFPSPMREPVVGDLHFADEETAAEVEAYARAPDGSAQNPFGAVPPTEPLADHEVPRLDWFEHGEKTVSIPAPVSFLAPPLGAPLDGGPAMAPAPAEEARSAEENATGEDELDATTPMPTLAVPPDALRSDDADLPERAKGFESGEIAPPPVTFAEGPAAADDGERPASGDEDDAPTRVTPMPAEVTARRQDERAHEEPPPALVATAAPAPQLDDDDVAGMRTLDRPTPVRAPTTTTSAPSPLEAPSSPLSQTSPQKPLARIALARKTAAQIEAERQAKASPRPASIDDLPAARPKPRDSDPALAAPAAVRAPREERVDDDEVTELSPFDPASAPHAPAPVGADARADDEAKRRRRKKRERGKRARKSTRELVVAPPPVEETPPPAPDDAEPTQVAAAPDEHALPSSLLGARLVELPEPQPPVALPSPTFASLFQSRPTPAEPIAQPVAEPVAPRAPPKERAAGEVMKLSDVVAFLDDD